MPSPSINRYIRELKSVFEGSPWYGDPVRTVLAGIDGEAPFRHPIPGGHSMAELLAHIIVWRLLPARRLSGDQVYAVTEEENFNWKRIDPDPHTAWKSLLAALEASQEELLESLSAAGDDLLSQKVPGKSYSFEELITGVIQHDIYHLGQIALLKKKQDSFTP